MKKGLKPIVIITLLILIGFLIKAFLVGNYEFVGYWVVLVALFLLVVALDKKFDFPLIGIALFAIWSVMHMAGGLIKISGQRLYGLILIDIIGSPYFILRYDQAIHIFCYFVITILVYFALKKYFKKGKKNKLGLIVFSILAGLGVSLLNEIIEFGMVIFADAAAAVGDYTNTALDMVSNLIGAILGAIFSYKFLDKK